MSISLLPGQKSLLMQKIHEKLHPFIEKPFFCDEKIVMLPAELTKLELLRKRQCSLLNS